MQSEILFSAKEKEFLDWDTINRLVDSNPDFKKFLEDLMEDIKVGKIKSKYDETYTEEEQMCQYALKCEILSWIPDSNNSNSNPISPLSA